MCGKRVYFCLQNTTRSNLLTAYFIQSVQSPENCSPKINMPMQNSAKPNNKIKYIWEIFFFQCQTLGGVTNFQLKSYFNNNNRYTLVSLFLDYGRVHKVYDQPPFKQWKF